MVPEQKQGQHLGDGGCGEKDVQGREIDQEKVHGLVEAGLCHHSHQNQGVTCNNEKIEEEKDKEDRKEERFRQRGDAC